ncbi:MAG: PIN domain-containing protein [Sphingobacteriia bacterium]|nr:MAG: PIN domain-containing protein [Sphingobacteriia bacterium]
MEVKVILLDTDFAFEYFSGNESALAVINVHRSDFIALPSVVMVQIIRACRDKRDLAKAIKMAANIPIVHINESISEKSLNIIKNHYLSNNAEIYDSIIAATAIHYSIHLATCNTKDFGYIPGLKLLEHSVTPKRRGGGLFGMF